MNPLNLLRHYFLFWISFGSLCLNFVYSQENVIPTKWDKRFSPPAIEGKVLGLASVDENVYIVGEFSIAGGLDTYSIAQWNTSTNTWSNLMSSGIKGVVKNKNIPTKVKPIHAVAVSGKNVYILRDPDYFKTILQWNGNKWSAIKGKINGTVHAIVGDDHGNLYVGGSFVTIDELTVNNLAKWDGTSWAEIGGGVNGTIYALATKGNELYIGGEFNLAGDLSTNYIVKWDGNTFSSLDKGVNSFVRAIAVAGENVYAGGEFNTASRVKANYIARWNGSEWSALGNGTNKAVHAIAVGIKGDIYVGGEFNEVDGIKANYVAKWDGNIWNSLGDGTNYHVFALIVTDQNEVFAGGAFDKAGSVSANRFAKWDGQKWYALGSGLSEGNPYKIQSGSVKSIVMNDDKVYVGGNFNTAGGITVNNIAVWDGQKWFSFDKGIEGSVNTIAIGNDGKFYAGGTFEPNSLPEIKNIAIWDGKQWASVGGGTSGTVNAIVPLGNDLYVGGSFYKAGTIPSQGFAKWDGSMWSDLAGSIAYKYEDGSVSGGTIHSIFPTANEELYVGGKFTEIGGIRANNIARWDGFSWYAVGQGVDEPVEAITVDKYGNVFVVTKPPKDQYGNEISDKIWLWDRRNWTVLEDDFIFVTPRELYSGGLYAGRKSAGKVYSLAVNEDGDLFVGGTFMMIGDVECNCVAMWDKSTRKWLSLGNGVQWFDFPKYDEYSGNIYGYEIVIPQVNAISVKGKEIYLGGSFAMAGENPSFYFARCKLNELDLSKLKPNQYFKEGYSTLQSGDYNLALKLFTLYQTDYDTLMRDYESYAFMAECYNKLGKIDSGNVVYQKAVENLTHLKHKNIQEINYDEAIEDIQHWRSNYPAFPAELTKESGYVPYNSMPLLLSPENVKQQKINRTPCSEFQNKSRGFAIIQILVDEKGKPLEFKVVATETLQCEKYILNLFKNATFTPPKKKGKPAKMWTNIPIMFMP